MSEVRKVEHASVHAAKPSEIDEAFDRYVTSPIGLVVAKVSARLRLTPTQVTIVGALVGIAGGAMLYDDGLGLLGFFVLVVHAILDSADGQLARRTGQVSEFGRVVDGLSGYVTHIAIFAAIAAGYLSRGGSQWILLWMLLAGIATMTHAQAYEYYRTAYAAVVNGGRFPRNETAKVSSWVQVLYRAYSAMQHAVVASHEAIGARLGSDRIAEKDRERYRETFRPLVLGWNLLGDNMRRFAVGLLAFLHRLDWFFAFVLLAMNALFLVMWLRQRAADRAFLSQR